MVIKKRVLVIKRDQTLKEILKSDIHTFAVLFPCSVQRDNSVFSVVRHTSLSEFPSSLEISLSIRFGQESPSK